MRIHLITDHDQHPLLVAAGAELRAEGHTVETMSPGEAARNAPDPSLLPVEALYRHGPADLYLLKARDRDALAIARHVESPAGRVVNSAAATENCQDRERMATVASAAGLPFPPSRVLRRLDAWATGGPPRFPLVVKSLHSRSHDLVARVDGPGRLEELAQVWPAEPVVVQDFVANDGWDRKLWVVGDEVFAGLRPSKLEPDGLQAFSTPPAVELPAEEIPAVWRELALRAGEAFDLDVYGVDLVLRGGEPLVVDVNAFPGMRGVAGAPRALARFAVRAGQAAQRAARHGVGWQTESPVHRESGI